MDESNNSKGIQLAENNPHFKVSDLIYHCSRMVQEGQLLRIEEKNLVNTDSTGFSLPNVFHLIYEKANDVLEFIANHFSAATEDQDLDGNSAFHRCIMDDYETGFNILIQILDVNRPGLSGLSPLMICSNLPHGHKYAHALLAQGADANYQEPYDGETALMVAAAYGNREMVDILLTVADKKIKSFKGRTAYDWAITEEHMEIAKLLI